MSTQWKYYNLGESETLLPNGVLVAAGGAASYLEAILDTFLKAAVEAAETAPGQAFTKKLQFLTHKSVISNLFVETIDLVFNGDEFSIDGVILNATAESITSEVLEYIAVVRYGLQANSAAVILGVATLSSVLWSSIKYVTTEVFDAIAENLPGQLELHFSDSTGEHRSGVYLPEGLDGTTAEYSNAVTYFINQAGQEISSGGAVEFTEPGFNTEFTIYNGNFIKELVPLTAAYDSPPHVTDIEEFLLYGNNLNAHVFKETYYKDTDTGEVDGNPIIYDHHYFFFEDDEVELTVPVIINETLHVIEVNNVIRGNVRQMGDGSGKSVIYPNTAGIVVSTDNDDLILQANNINAGDGDDTLIGTSGNDSLYGNDDEDIIDGGLGNDLLFGGADNDTLYGWYGHDTLQGGDGDNQLNGGSDYDWVDYRYTDIDGFSNNLAVNLNNTVIINNVGTDQTDTLVSIEAVVLGNGDHVVLGNNANNIVISGLGDDSINGQDGHDELHGGAGLDSIWGHSGRDVLYGEGGNDTLYGDANSDALVGGAGNDWLYGGNHSDIYWFGTADGEDTIDDTHGADRILLFDEQVLMAGATTAISGGGYWQYQLVFGDTLQGGQSHTALFHWDGDPMQIGSRGDLFVDFDNTQYYDVVIKNYMNGEFGMTLFGAALHPWSDPDNGEPLPDVFFEIVPPDYVDYEGLDGPPNKDPGTPIPPEPTEEPDITVEEDISNDGGTTGGDNSGAGFIEDEEDIEDAVGGGAGVGGGGLYEEGGMGTGAGVAGDPHVLTHDGSFYDFQDSGEYVLTRSTDTENPLLVQVRTEPFDLGDAVGEFFSVNTAIAMQLGEMTVGFYVPGSLPYDLVAAAADSDPLNDEEPILYLGAHPVFIANGTHISLEDGSFITRNGSEYAIETPQGDYMRVIVNDTHINYFIYISEERNSGSVEGLLGNYDGDATNDFILDDGTPLGASISENTLYNVFGEDWRITQAESLFLYGSGLNTSSFDNPNFDDTQRTLADFDPLDVSAAETAAIAEGFDPNSDVFDAVVLDFLVMGYVEYDEIWEMLEQQSVTEADISGDDIFYGTALDDILSGTNGNDYIMALEGEDTVYGAAGNDTIIGGLGDDVLQGQTGIDLYIHQRGDGSDHLYSGEANSSDYVFMFGDEGLLLEESEMQFVRAGNDLQVIDRANGETLTLDNMFHSSSSYNNTFASVNGIDISGGLNFVGTDNSENISATIHDDTLEGGLGNDTLYGYAGIDLFVHRQGHGNDHLYSGEAGSSDYVFMFGSDDELLDATELQFVIAGYDLEVVNRASGETLTLDNMFHSSSSYNNTFASVNNIDISNGLSFVGTDNSEVINGSNYNDTIEGGLGNDTLYGKDGIDLFLHRQGDGNDHIYSGEANSSDSIEMYGADGMLLDATELSFVQSGNDLIVTNLNSSETLTLDNMLHSSSSYNNTFDLLNGIDLSTVI